MEGRNCCLHAGEWATRLPVHELRSNNKMNTILTRTRTHARTHAHFQKPQLMETAYGHRLVGVFGYSHLSGGYPGGQAEYARVPHADVSCLPIPDSVPDEKARYISDVLCTSLHAVEMVWALSLFSSYALLS